MDQGRCFYYCTLQNFCKHLVHSHVETKWTRQQVLNRQRHISRWCGIDIATHHDVIVPKPLSSDREPSGYTPTYYLCTTRNNEVAAKVPDQPPKLGAWDFAFFSWPSQPRARMVANATHFRPRAMSPGGACGSTCGGRVAPRSCRPWL